MNRRELMLGGGPLLLSMFVQQKTTEQNTLLPFDYELVYLEYKPQDELLIIEETLHTMGNGRWLLCGMLNKTSESVILIFARERNAT